MRKQKRVVVFDEEKYDGEWPPFSAIECIVWFAKKIETIPSEHLATATIEIDSVVGYENVSYARIVIKYVRPETDDEMVAREKEELLIREAQKDLQLRELAALKAKYEK